MTATPMQLEDWLDDLCVRFIINLPEEDLSSVARICFQVEEAQWFYEDFIRPLNPNLPSMTLRKFCLRIFQHCPLLASFSFENHTKAFEEFLQYKTRVPVRGAIMLNQAMDSVVLVKGWKKGANWSFPRGKINKDEDDLDCAVREVYEETGLDLRAAGLVPTEKKPKYIEISMREQQLRLYVFRDIPMNTKFQPRTRKEISKIQWYKLSQLPAFRKKGTQPQNESTGPSVNKFYMVAPFLFALKKWITSQKRVEEKRATSGPQHLLPHHVVDEVVTTEDDTWAPAHSQEQTHVPAIETLDGATRELQRLLKMQPPTQGLQQPLPQSSQPQEDKGSALLSILQSNNPRPFAERHQDATPHTPLQATPFDVSQPRNPQHHTNPHHGGIETQHPPPSFPIPQSHETFMRDSAILVSQLQHSSSSLSHHAEHVQQQIKSPHERHAHLQPHSSTSPLASAPQQYSSQQNMTNSMNHTFNMSSVQETSLRQSHPLLAVPGSTKLSGASLALLNAFKRDPVPAATQSPPISIQATASVAFEPQRQTQTEQIRQASVSELVGSSVQPIATDQHRSALLGMFKKSPSSIASPTSQPPATDYPLPITIDQQITPVQKIEVNAPLPQAQDNGSSGGQHLTAVEQLYLQTKPNAPAMSSSPHGGNRTRTPHQPHTRQHSYQQLHRQQQQQQQQQKPQRRRQQQKEHAKSPLASNPSLHQFTTPRILQRGQNIDDISDPRPPQRAVSSRASASPFSSHLSPVQTASGLAEPQASLSDGRYKPEGARDQKNQLLSLFGKQHSLAMEKAELGDRPRSRISSIASKGGETPISPAEQTFLLGYLQSVTNNAARR
ncbi:hypothetical protein E4U21_007880 [Claviceps maximensis]|nr:hypothetical protein E4U21_007880 [Claviceps maximensis]